MNISLEWVKINDLFPHEDIIPEIVECNIRQIMHKRKVIPIIVDKNTGLILDGHHRYEAFLRLRLKEMPAYTVDYMSNEIIVNSWYRLIKPNINIKGFDEGEYCAIYNQMKILCENSLYKLYWRMNLFEQQLKKMGFSIIKNKERGIIMPSLPKKYIIDISMKGLRFPPKSTRHEYKFYIPKEEIELNGY